MALVKYAKTCASNTPGNQAVYLAAISGITSVTVTSDEVSAITTTASAFKELEADLDSVQRIENVASANNTSITHQLVMAFSKPAKTLQTLRKSLADLMPCGVAAIVVDGNSQAWLVGWGANEKGKRALRKLTDTLDTGKLPTDTDVQRATITLEGIDSDFDIPFDATQTAAIIAQTANYIEFN